MGTLVHDPFFREMPSFFGMTFERFLREKHAHAWVEFELGVRDHDAFMHNFFADGRGFDHDAFCECVQGAYCWLPQVEPLLERLKRAGVQMHVLSNYPLWYEWIETRLGISRYMPWSFVSTNTGFRKPDDNAFMHPADQLGVPFERIVFVDDRESNCRAALALGIDAIRFETAEKLQAALKRRKIL